MQTIHSHNFQRISFAALFAFVRVAAAGSFVTKTITG
jgi:hypothetical protein